MEVHPLFQMSGRTRFVDTLLKLINDESIVGCHAMVAFTTLNGVLLLGPAPDGALHSLLKRGGKLRLILGIDATTTSNALQTLKTLADEFPTHFELRAFQSQDHTLFHPKYYLFERRDASGVVVVGSNNLTGPGLAENTEMAIRADIPAPSMAQWMKPFDEISQVSGAVLTITSDLLERVTEMRRLETKARRASAKHMATAGGVTEVCEDAQIDESRVLLQTVPRAGDRWSQVGIRALEMNEFFGLTSSSTLSIGLQQVLEGSKLGPVEKRNLVRSDVNANSRIEVKGLQGLVYPPDPQRRPILIFEDAGDMLFRYIVLMPGDKGYDEVNAYLATLQHSRTAMPNKIITVGELLEVWPDYPV